MLLIGFKEKDGRPFTPAKEGLQNISNSDKHITSLTQVLVTEFGSGGPQVKMRSVEVLGKNVKPAKTFPTPGQTGLGPARKRQPD